MAKIKIPVQPKSEFRKIYYAGIFLVSLSTLLLEFTLIRLLSVSMWYHFAFMIISVAMLGFGISGTFLVLNSKIRNVKTSRLLSAISLFYGCSIILVYYLINKIPLDPFSLFTDSNQLLYLPLFYILITIPFFFSGLIISYLLIGFKKNLPEIYSFDLIGAGIACFVFVLVMPIAEGNGMIAVITVIALFACILFSISTNNGFALTASILIVISLFFLVDKNNYLPLNVSPSKSYFLDSIVFSSSEEKENNKLYTSWNTISKIDVYKDEAPSEDGYDIFLTIFDEGSATTNIPKVQSFPLIGKPADASNIAYVLKDSAEKVFIIGSAGGGEILAGLYHNAKIIIGAEINGIINDLIENKFAYWTGPLIKNNNRVKLITDDARATIIRDDTQYDLIISAHTISSAAVSSGAMSLVENYILTEEAISEYIRHLKRDGIIYISRPETQIPKLIATFKKTDEELKSDTIPSSKKFCVFRRPSNEFERGKSYLAGILYKKNGFDDFDIFMLRNEVSKSNMELLYEPVSPSDTLYKKFIETDYKNLSSIPFPYDINPATDDKPFFDNVFGFSRLSFAGIKESFSQDNHGIIAIKDKPVAESALILILIQVVIIAFLCLIVPFFIQRKKQNYKFDFKIFLYFSFLGLGYILTQISLIQKFTLFLGQPVYTMLTVISTLLIFSGVGSRMSVKYLNSAKRLYLIFILIALFLLLNGILTPAIFVFAGKFVLLLRIVISILLIAPLALLLGMPFPVGMSVIDDSNYRFSAFCWAVNGFFSVIGSVIAIIAAMIIGFKLILLFSALLYLLSMFLVKSRIVFK
jgi:hypothetical protein